MPKATRTRFGRPAGILTVLLVLAGCSGIPTYQCEPDAQNPQPWLVQVVFVGGDGIAQHRLHRIVEDHMYDLSRDPKRRAAALDATFDLEDSFRQLGYADVQIGFHLDTPREGEIEVRFEIAQGPLVTLRSPELIGNRAFTDAQLLQLWSRRAADTLGLGDAVFVESEIAAFSDSLSIFYRTQGYLDVTIQAPEIQRSTDREHATAKIRIDEGAAYRITSIELDPALRETLPAEAIEVIQAPAGQIAAAHTLEAIRQHVVSSLRRHGYPTPRARLNPTRDPRDHGVALLLTGEPGHRARVAEISITGNERTNESFVRNRIEVEPNAIYDGTSIDHTRRNLYLTGLFRRVDIDHEWLDDERVRLKVGLDEDDSRSIDILAGYGSYERARGSIRFEERNVFGTGRRLAIEGRGSTTGYRTAVTATDPWVFGSDNRLSIAADRFKREEPSYIDRANGITTAISRDFGTGWRGRFGHSLRRRSGSTSDLADDLDNYTEGNMFAELKLDRRDSLLYPRQGFLISLQVDGDDPAFGSDIAFVRARFTTSAFFPLYGDTHLALHGSHGALWPGESSSRIPLQQRFFNGGENTVRSFRESRLGPLDAFGKPIGGEYRNVLSAEIRTPLHGLLEAAIFADAGNVGSSVKEFGFSNLRYALGVGCRLKLPIGPVRVDGAFNPDRAPGEDEWVIHLSVGYPF